MITPEPHFHAHYGGNEGKVSVRDGKLIAGKLPLRAMKLVKEWVNGHKKNWKITGS